ncbi:putative aminotransferase [Oceanicola granulosus HTCC2516]|uniref:Cysteine desulfurase n=1 Tax=Oceanicola granulosus (strain ATCC BAA-861 / DSM 15982 / KCTC 12143 / HTCC2516) TaxID=314256 RepID=Q2CG72_OCEGH|nr:cysteine desulfurase family protein [Oceanicola granulosus]EAR51657.1 putative aminotransferase [Oceanicola granulosus HTCC2516]
MTRVYLDHNATASLRDEARAAMVAAMDVVGNPSSVHAEGRAAKGLVEAARADLAEALGAQGFDIVFTSGATEAAALALSAGWSRVLGSAVEHDAVAAWADRVAWETLPVGRDGRVGAVAAAPGELVAVQAANSETGVLQALELDTGGALRLVDLVQLVGRVPVALSWLPPALYMISAHKFGGPKGVGALLVPQGTDLPALLVGGGQEMGRRSGTENVVGIAGMAAAARAAMAELAGGAQERIGQFRNILESAIAAGAPETIFVGKDSDRLPNTSCLVTPGWKGETQVMAMDLAGFAVSAGSACSSGKVRASRVLGAMGYDDEAAASAIRVSLGPETTEDEVLRFAETWTAKLKRHRARAA